MSAAFSESDLEAYLDEALPAEDMTRLEKTLRDQPALVRRLAAIHARRNAGVHSLGEIWRRHRLSCPSREELGSYLLRALPDDAAAYAAFHLDVIGCRRCQANLIDLQNQQAEAGQSAQTRRHRYFQSSAGYLRRKP
jgi:hypothetical protein